MEGLGLEIPTSQFKWNAAQDTKLPLQQEVARANESWETVRSWLVGIRWFWLILSKASVDNLYSTQ